MQTLFLRFAGVCGLSVMILTGCAPTNLRPPGALPVPRDMQTPQMQSVPLSAAPGGNGYPMMHGGGMMQPQMMPGQMMPGQMIPGQMMQRPAMQHPMMGAPPMQAGASHPSMASPRMPNPYSTGQIPVPAVARPTATTDAGAGPFSPEIAQVGFTERLAPGSCGCTGCGTSDCTTSCNQAPFGYAEPPMGNFNSYGTDPQEFLCDGGDRDAQAKLRRDGNIGGLDPQDTVVHYVTDAGDTKIQPSTRACVYAPRFSAVRQVTGAIAGERALGAAGMDRPVGPTGIGFNLPSLAIRDTAELVHANVTKRVDAMRDRNRGVPVEGIVQVRLAEDVLRALATLDRIVLDQLNESQLALLEQSNVAAQTWMIRDAVEVMIESMQPPVLIRDAKVESFVEYDFPDAGRLRILKMADRSHAQQGEEVSFVIRVDNVGDSAVNEVVIADNLVARLEYVENSETCDRDAQFEVRQNDVGSLRLKWSLAEPLEVGEGAVIEFKCKVR